MNVTTPVPSSGGSRWYRWLQVHIGENPFSIIFSTIFFLLFAGLIWWLADNTAGAPAVSDAVSTNRLVAAVGGLLGWIVGVGFAPFSGVERKHFRSLGKAISLFVTGYLLGKLDRFLELALFPESPDIPVIAWQRVGLFAAAFLLAGIVVFTHRLYAFRRD